MHSKQSRPFRHLVTLVAVLAAATALTAVPAAAEPVPTGSGPSTSAGVRAGTGFRAGPAVHVLENRNPAAAAVIQATPPQSFCYVGAVWPASIDAEWKATATWTLDCRSRANPNAPAPDIFVVLMDVRIYQGEYTPWDRGREVMHTSCSRGGTTPSCSTTTSEPLTFGAPYYTMLRVQVALTGGTNQEGEFYTAPLRRT
jgi:hypothetical protein